MENLITETDLTTPQVGCDNKDSPYDLGDRLLQEINSVSAYLMITPCDTLDETEPFLMMTTSDGSSNLETTKLRIYIFFFVKLIFFHSYVKFKLSEKDTKFETLQ